MESNNFKRNKSTFKLTYSKNTPSPKIESVRSNDNMMKQSTHVNSNFQSNNPQFETEEIDKDEIKSLCLNVFINFAKINNKDKNFYLSYFDLMKILRTINIIGKNMLNQNEIELLLKKINHGDPKLNSDQFMNFLVLLSNKLDPDNFSKDPKYSTIKMIKMFLIPLSNYIHEKEIDNDNEFLQHKDVQNKINETRFDDNVIFILNNIYDGIKYIYKTYFFFEVNDAYEPDIKTKSLSDLLRFCKDFNITPYLITAERVSLFYHILINMSQEEITKHDLIYQQDKDIGIYFTISKFASIIFHLSLISLSKYEKYLNITKQEVSFDGDLENAGKLILFLERLQNCSGFESLNKLTSTTFNSKMHILPNKKIIEEISPILNKVIGDTYKYNTRQKNMKIREIHKIPDNYSDVDCSIIFSFDDEKIISLMNSNLFVLRELFETYSNIGDKMNFYNMTFSAYLKFLKDLSIIDNDRVGSKISISKIASLRQLSKSPNRMSTVSKSNSNFLNGISKSNYNLKRKISEQEASLIFQSLCGMKNFDNIKLKQQFNKNSGSPTRIIDSSSNFNFDKNSSIGRTQNTIPNKMNFFLFLKSFELLANKIYPELIINKAMEMLINEKLEAVFKETFETFTAKRSLLEMLTFLKRDEIINLADSLSPAIMPHFDNYSDKNGFIKYENFFTFYKDFNIYPEIINIVQLKNIFSTLSDLLISSIENSMISPNSQNDTNISETIKSEFVKYEKLNFNLFMDSLILSSMHTKLHFEGTEISKIFYLLEKMSSSKGVSKSQARNGQTFSTKNELSIQVTKLKKSYPELRNKKDMKELLNSQSCFDEIFDF